MTHPSTTWRPDDSTPTPSITHTREQDGSVTVSITDTTPQTVAITLPGDAWAMHMKSLARFGPG
jgi:VCBS repeat-containing protein